ncbi:MAG: Asp-tRNA(Asn)/Glu-tRNA(Gln) amidotransferase subunit GatC [Clostridia bacterium]|nr:Asp-tRNA(Asn)/Glu-tRNA(Gln) amidotransferase subunit GatC [Clostridia bacterium]
MDEKFDIEYLEALSKLKIDDAEKEKFAKDFANIVKFVDQITQLDLPELEDRSKAVCLSQLREDEVVEKEECDVVANAPKKKDGCYVTPMVVE